MARRSADWNEGLAKDLKDPNFAREFISAALTEGVSIQLVLGKVIRAEGVKEFSKRAGMHSSNVLRAIHPKYNSTHKTLNQLLRPLGLRLTVTFIEPLRKKLAA